MCAKCDKGWAKVGNSRFFIRNSRFFLRNSRFFLRNSRFFLRNFRILGLEFLDFLGNSSLRILN